MAEFSTSEHELVLVIDFGGQYNQLIARRVRENNVYCEIYSYKTDLSVIKAKNPKGIIFTGGPNSVYLEDSPTIDPEIFNWGVPVLGICYGETSNEERMEHFLSQAADLGSRDAMSLLAEHFYTMHNSEKAAYWARRMYAAGMDEARYLLIGSLQALECYDEELIGLLQELAEQGDREARFALGTCYLEGKGVARDYAKAMVWYLLAARQGHPMVQNNVGYMYEEKLIASPGPDAAAVWYLRAASNGCRLGQENLEEFYRKKNLGYFGFREFRIPKWRCHVS